MSEGANEQDRAWSRWMAATQDGDAVAYDRLLRAITPFVRTLVRKSIANPDQAEDVVQDVLLTVHRIRHTYDPHRPFSPWLSTIASRRTIDAIRRGMRIAARETANADAYETIADDAANQEGELSVVSQAELRAWLDELPAGQRQAVELLKLREMSLAEASAASGHSVAALKVSVHRAIRALRAKLTLKQE